MSMQKVYDTNILKKIKLYLKGTFDYNYIMESDSHYILYANNITKVSEKTKRISKGIING